MKKLILSIIMTASSVLLMAQNHIADEQVINKQIDAFFASWNNHIFSDMANYTTDDCNWVNVVGMWWQGRKQVQFAHQAFHDGMFKATSLTKISTQFRFITKDVALVYMISKVGEYYPPDGVNRGANKAGDEEDIATLVFVKKGRNWLLTSGHNINISAQAAKSNPVLKMK